ncbi:MAG: hypothetical protein JNN18_10045 [Rubrivivax sp.]|nr:hypothetical protein [Rubrivivax sp.]
MDRFAHFLLLPACLAAFALPLAARAAGCQDRLFVDDVPAEAWRNLDLAPHQGTAGLREALRTAQREHAGVPVRIRLAPGVYADTLGAEVYAQRIQRGPANPLAIVATDPRPDATVLMHGINLLGVAYVAIDGVTIGPARVGAWDGTRHADPQPIQAAAGIHVSGAAIDGRRNAAAGGTLDLNVYGRYEPSHHIVVRRVTVQNLFGTDERDAETSESLSMDGMKFNQVQDLWVLDSSVNQTTRHGIDNVGVHRAAFCRNVVARTGGGLGIEAKGGSVDVLYDSNTFYRVRRVELGGEETDATYYYSLDGRWDYEALRTVARNNLIVDAREAALEFSGCADCTAIHNTIVHTASYRPPSDGGTFYGGDALRIHASRILSADDGAGSDCQTWDEAAQDYVTADPCWGVGARAPAPVNRVLPTRNATLWGNLFVSHAGHWGLAGGDVTPCPLNAAEGAEAPWTEGNRWWNAGRPLPTDGCTPLATPMASSAPLPAVVVDDTRIETLASTILTAALPVTPAAAGTAAAHPAAAAHDRLGAPRAATAAIGAIESLAPDSDRLFNFAQRQFPQWFGSAPTSTLLQGWYARQHSAQQTYIGTRDGRLAVLGPPFGSGPVDLGLLATWLAQAKAAGF